MKSGNVYLAVVAAAFFLTACGSSSDTDVELSGIPGSGSSSDTDVELSGIPGIGIDPDDPTSFGRLPQNLRLATNAWSVSNPPITSGTSHGLSSWIGRDLLCNGRNNVAQIDSGAPTLMRYELSGAVTRRNAIGTIDPSCDVSAISDPDLCFLQEDVFDGNETWGVFNLQGSDGSTVPAIHRGIALDTDQAIDGINYQDGFIEYQGILVTLTDSGNEVCVPLENATVGL